MDPIQARNTGHFSVVWVWGEKTRNRGGIDGLGVIRFVSISLFLVSILPPSPLLLFCFFGLLLTPSASEARLSINRHLSMLLFCVLGQLIHSFIYRLRIFDFWISLYT